jgi:hypothetical protein
MLLPLALAVISPYTHSTASTYNNPVVDVDSPDPGVLGTSDGGFVAVTSSGGEIVTDVFPIRVSANLAHWTIKSFLFPGKSHPRWASPPFYAPEIHGPIVESVQGKSCYWAVYDAMENASGAMVVGAAWAYHPTGPFTDLGKPLQRVVGAQSLTVLPLLRSFSPAPRSTASAIDSTLWQNHTDGRVSVLLVATCATCASILPNTLCNS